MWGEMGVAFCQIVLFPGWREGGNMRSVVKTHSVHVTEQYEGPNTTPHNPQPTPSPQNKEKKKTTKPPKKPNRGRSVMSHRDRKKEEE